MSEMKETFNNYSDMIKNDLDNSYVDFLEYVPKLKYGQCYSIMFEDTVYKEPFMFVERLCDELYFVQYNINSTMAFMNPIYEHETIVYTDDIKYLRLTPDIKGYEDTGVHFNLGYCVIKTDAMNDETNIKIRPLV
jgi:hypothetical protein